jgi:predicted PurR-regulated permease PerM
VDDSTSNRHIVAAPVNDGLQGRSGDGDGRRVHPVVERLAAYGWRLLVLAAVLVVLRWVLGRLWVIVLALVVATFLARALTGPNRWLRTHGLPASLAAGLTLLGFLGVLVLGGWFIVPAVTDEFSSLGPTLTEAVDDVQQWLVEDAPVDLDERDIEEFRTQAGDALVDVVSSSGGSLASGALTAVEAVTGIILGLLATFFFLKDGPKFQRWALARTPAARRDLARRLAGRAWATLGGYLRGAAMLGAIEGAAIGITLAIVGAGLVVPVVILTFAAAFIPFVGAIVAGVVAVLVALATAGFGGAIVVAIVALAVQQLDNDFLAPVVYGRALALHPLIILFSIVAGGALIGFAGTVLAVPVTAVAVNVAAEAGLGRPRADSELEAAAVG